ncbi:SpoIIAA family protein [Gilvimarinus agarilyticus]|uniref:STAS/SEC14 domain-containing protein n=1 Tax=Gilvimarinus agarilyticus TaxID=679259 RepID=UPI0005A0F641|nr:STAS/SEC14 domain-containing protein [Gilvimarinus agarilyticus]
MLQIEKIDNHLNITLSGRLNKEQMSQALDDLMVKARGVDHGTMLYDVVDFKLPEPRAVLAEFMRMPSMLGLIRKFDRVAVLADQSWLQKISELEGMLIPGLELKAFSRADRAAAETWLKRSP